MVVGTSALLALLFGERHAEWVADQLNSTAGALYMSTVNLSEVLILLRDRQPTLFDALEQQVLDSGIAFIAPDVEAAQIAAVARIRFPLNLGDCFAYALAVKAGLPILTLDRDFRGVDVPVRSP